MNLSWSSLQMFIPDTITVASMRFFGGIHNCFTLVSLGKWTKPAESTSPIILNPSEKQLLTCLSPSPKPMGHNRARRILMLVHFFQICEVPLLCSHCLHGKRFNSYCHHLRHRGHHWICIHWYVSKGTS